MVEPRLPGPTDYPRILATYAKWCHTIWKDSFPGTCVPTTASIKVIAPTDKRPVGSSQSFWVSTSLPHAPLKEEARLIRERYMHDAFGQLPDAPIFVEAIKGGGDWGRVKWGHCAETLTIMRYVFRPLFSNNGIDGMPSSYLRTPIPEVLSGVTIRLKPVAKAPKYSPLVFSQATVEACDNCQVMMKHAKIVYRDWHRQGMSGLRRTLPPYKGLWNG